ncbi:hypothetical protein GCM10025857_37790 [Alicyclobacillus contaminans]|nr:hypothetical protein GCM10025857_37790 [Alicyclobacillus contaminans]
MDMNVRVLEAEDAAAYRRLRLEALLHSPEAFQTTYEDFAARSLEQIAAQLAPSPSHVTLGAHTPTGHLVGTVTLVQEQGRKVQHIANVFGMFVAAPWRRRGVGRMLLEAVIAHSQQWPGVEQLRLSVVRSNDGALRLYESLGFQKFGIEPNALKLDGDAWDEVHMVLSLTHREGAPRGFDAYGARGFNHVTINVADLAVSLSFYVDTLGMALVHRGRRDVYLEWGDAWICLQERPELPSPNAQLGVDHVALHVSPTAFHRMVEILRTRNVPLVRGPLEREVAGR